MVALSSFYTALRTLISSLTSIQSIIFSWFFCFVVDIEVNLSLVKLQVQAWIMHFDFGHKTNDNQNQSIQNMLNFQRGVTSVIVASSTEQGIDLLLDWPGSNPWAEGFDLGPFPKKNPGVLGTGRVTELFVSIWYIVDNVGRSTGFSWTHNIPIWIYLMTSSRLQSSLIPLSTSSINDSFSQSLQTCWSS